MVANWIESQVKEVAREEEERRVSEVMANEVRRRLEKKREVEVVIRKGPPRMKEGEQRGAEGGKGVEDWGDKGKGKAVEGGGVKTIPKADLKDAGGGPQYRYQSAAEDTTLVKAVFDRAMSRTVEVSQRELLALAPKLRWQMKEMTTTKRVPVARASANVLGEVEVWRCLGFMVEVTQEEGRDG